MPEYDVSDKLRKRMRIIRVLLCLAVLSFAGMFVLIRWGLSNTNAKKEVIDMCVQNGPTAPTWPQQLAQYGLSGKSDAIIRPYCECMWMPALDKMSVSDMKAFFKKTPRQQIQVLGGENAMIAHNKQCMLQVKSKL